MRRSPYRRCVTLVKEWKARLPASASAWNSGLRAAELKPHWARARAPPAVRVARPVVDDPAQCIASELDRPGTVSHLDAGYRKVSTVRRPAGAHCGRWRC